MNTPDPKDKDKVVNQPTPEETAPSANDDSPAVEGDWDDEDDEDFDDRAADAQDLHDIQEGANFDNPTPEDDDHLPDDFLN